MTQSLQTQKLPGLGAPFPYSTQGGSYSVQTPYGFQLDLDFLKYVEEIESGCKLRRPPKLSQRSSGAGWCPPSNWRVKAALSPASSEDSQGGLLEHTPSAPSEMLSRPPSSVVGTETPPPPSRASLARGPTEPGQGAKVSPHSPVSGDGSSGRDVHLQLDAPAGPLHLPRSSRGGDSDSTQATPDPPTELGVALQQLREMEERVRGMVALESEVGELRAERDRLLQALQGGTVTQERPLPAGGMVAGGRGEPRDRERPPHPASHAHSRVQTAVRRWVREEGEGERSERFPETGGVEAERRTVAVGDDRPLERSVFWREVRDVAVGMVAVVTRETGVGTDETERCEVGVQVGADTAEVSLMTESESDGEVGALRDTVRLQRESIQVLEARLGRAQREREALRRSRREAEREAFTSSYRSSDEAERWDSTPRRNNQQTQTEIREWAGEKTSPAVTSRGSQWESPHEGDELAVSIVMGGQVTTAGEGTVSVMEREEGSCQETRPFRPPAVVLKSIMKRRDDPGSADPGRKKSLQFVGILNGGYESTSSEEEEDEELEEGSSSSTGGAGVFSDSSEGDMEPLEDTSSEERNISLEDSDSDLEEAARGESDDSDEKFELSAKMRDAFLVLREHLHDDASALNGEDVLSCSRTVRLEWFRVSSGPSARPAHLASFLSAFSEAFPGLQEGVVNMTDSNGNSALHYSVSHSNFGVVSLLLDTGVCHVDRRNRAGYTAIMLAALASVREEDDMQVVRRLFSAGDVNAKASQAGQTALMLAVSHGRQEMVQVLLDCGADVNVQDDEGSTALMCACEHGRADITALLLQHPGCDCSLVDNDGSNALSIAMDASHGDIAVLLYAHMNSSSAPPARTCQPMPGSPSIPKKTRTHE
ncbi:KN motif and ankyrin repeat domain-containing protein 3-like [Megalops cyprinoides]|uniref:KN motif and ankyrin repeat domain-containing protein 3-like n=1 Tax=Megalops cyprinoides TaxID=118141 RepID=UPI001865172E|nr:KN motif and ankyrin repeat domain-containing protein 3-like [Megalops cyprinoides]XP_036410675.1 KN motif and ankyrin repeat domain-containing protein 3-like [Megalops cyprinoides]